jgi:hypothetical protein
MLHCRFGKCLGTFGSGELERGSDPLFDGRDMKMWERHCALGESKGKAGNLGTDCVGKHLFAHITAESRSASLWMRGLIHFN